jgi:hypothetical protein
MTTEDLHSGNSLPVHPQAPVLSNSDWSTYLSGATADKNGKWISVSGEKVSAAGWADSTAVSVLAQPMLVKKTVFCRRSHSANKLERLSGRDISIVGKTTSRILVSL